jgi:hypothetical protein
VQKVAVLSVEALACGGEVAAHLTTHSKDTVTGSKQAMVVVARVRTGGKVFVLRER